MEPPTTIIAGVDTHTGTHTLALLDMNGRVLSTNTFGADPDGYGRLIAMLGAPARCAGIGVEGTNSFGAALARRLQAAGFPVYEMLNPIPSTRSPPRAACWPATERACRKARTGGSRRCAT